MRYLKIFSILLFNILYFTQLNASLENKIVVKVGDKIITEFDIKNKILTSLILAEQNINQSNIDALKEPTLESIIIHQLKKIELSKFNFQNDKSEVVLYINQITKSEVENLKSRFDEKGLDFDLFYEEVETQLKWQKLIYSFYKEKINIDDNEINKEIEDLSTRQKNSEEFRISELEVLLNNDKNDKNLIDSIDNQIKQIGFENAVIKFSVSNSSANKGDLGWINADTLSKKISEIVSNLKIGQISKPIIRQNSVLFLKLADKRATVVKNQDLKILKNNLINQKKNELFNLYSNSHLSKLKNTTYIEYKKMKNILIISGDPNSINSELIFKLWKKININTKKKIYIISNYNLLKKQFRKLKYKIKISKVTDLNKKNTTDLKIIDVDLKFKNPFSVSNKSASKFLTRSLEIAHSFALKKNIVG